jgi:hypothetical protein
MLRTFLLLALVSTRAVWGYAQATHPDRIKIFLNCAGEDCHEDYLITELSFFDVVRDRFQADVQVLIIEQITAAAGSRFSLSFLGQKRFAGLTDSAAVVTKASDTDVMVREALLAAIKTGLARYVLQTAWKSGVRVEYEARPPEALVLPQDRWKNWVFTVGLDGEFDGESRRSSVNVNTYASAYRITPNAKIMADVQYEYNVNQFRLDSQTIRIPVDNYSAALYYAHSLSGQWSAGFFAEAEHDKFQNLRLQHRLAPAIEYNFYDFSENTRRQLRLGYQVGYRRFSYLETTIFDRIWELRPYHQVALVANYAQPWGTVNAVVQARSFLDRFSQNRFTTRVNLGLRLFEGFNLNVEGFVSLVNDQISLARRVASEEEFLLRGTQLPTRLLYEGRIGLTYTFGSTNNSIVNPRFENIDD